MSTNVQTILTLAKEVEIEMKRLGLWGEELDVPIADGAFGGTATTFEEWLQLVFLPNLRRAASSNTLPASSNVGVAAVRNLDGVAGAERLIELLSRIDSMVEQLNDVPH
jgi:uncharacterized protein YqcC (DUF446 family)